MRSQVMVGGVDVRRASELYNQGWTLHQIGVELGVKWTSERQQLRVAPASGPPRPNTANRRAAGPRADLG
jgi:hypothetical protein